MCIQEEGEELKHKGEQCIIQILARQELLELEDHTLIQDMIIIKRVVEVVDGIGGGAGGVIGSSGGGGSGFVFTSSAKVPSGYLLDSKYILSDAETIIGTEKFIAPNGSLEVGHSGNGYARITAVD